MTLSGNPPLYIIIYGGFTYSSSKIFLNDLWSFSLYSHKWRKIIPNN